MLWARLFALVACVATVGLCGCEPKAAAPPAVKATPSTPADTLKAIEQAIEKEKYYEPLGDRKYQAHQICFTKTWEFKDDSATLTVTAGGPDDKVTTPSGATTINQAPEELYIDWHNQTGVPEDERAAGKQAIEAANQTLRTELIKHETGVPPEEVKLEELIPGQAENIKQILNPLNRIQLHSLAYTTYDKSGEEFAGKEVVGPQFKYLVDLKYDPNGQVKAVLKISANGSPPKSE
jgi:hypothetical protein